MSGFNSHYRILFYHTDNHETAVMWNSLPTEYFSIVNRLDFGNMDLFERPDIIVVSEASDNVKRMADECCATVFNYTKSSNILGDIFSLAMEGNANKILNFLDYRFNNNLLLNLLKKKNFREYLIAKATSEYALMIFKEFKLNLNEISKIKLGSLIHNIGIISLPDAVIGENLDNRYFYNMIPQLGLKMVPDDIDDIIYSIIALNLERNDGSGPFGLKKDDIPIEAGIVATASIYANMVYENLGFDEATINMLYENPRLDEDAIKMLYDLSVDDKIISRKYVEALNNALRKSMNKSVKRH